MSRKEGKYKGGKLGQGIREKCKELIEGGAGKKIR